MEIKFGLIPRQKNIKRGLKIKLTILILFFSEFCSCNINYPEIQELDYKINYYFTRDNRDYFMTFDFAIKVLNPKDVFKVVIENKNTNEFIQVIKSNYSLFFNDSSLGKDILYCRDLRFNIFDKLFESFIASVLIIDTGMRVYNKELVVSLELKINDLNYIYNCVYKYKDMTKLRELSNSKVFFIKTSKGSLQSVSSVSKIEPTISVNNLEIDKNADNYISFYYVAKNSNLFFKID